MTNHQAIVLIDGTSGTSAPINSAPAISKKSRANQILEIQEKEQAILQLICRFGLSTRKVASFFVDDPKGYVIKRMLAKGLIAEHRKAKIPAFTRTFQAEHEVITLTALGLRIFYQQRGEDIAYPEINPAKINYTHASHTLEGQLAIKKMLMHRLICEYETERMIDPKNKLGPKKFDLVAVLNSTDCFGKKAGIEIELSSKYDKAMCDTRKRVCNALMRTDRKGDPEFAYVFYFMDKPLLRRYQTEFCAGASIYEWVLNSKKKFVRGEVDLVIPPYLAARILFFPILNLKAQGGLQ